MKPQAFLLLILFLAFPVILSAQKAGKRIEVTGTVVDASGNPIGNAIVLIDGKNTSTVTGPDGKYKIKVKPDAQRLGILTFSSGIKEENIGGRTEINFRFGVTADENPVVSKDNNLPADEGVNTGYSHIKRKNAAGDIDKIDGTNKKYASYSSIYEMIEREVSGVKRSGNNFIIRDSKDFFGSVPALMVVDGTYVDDISGIKPTEVESIEVLKGASASMYGSRGYGGVIIIKTKIKN